MAERPHRLVGGTLVRTGSACNLACLGCPMVRRGGELPLWAIAEQLDAAQRSGALRAILVGGEPTIRRDLPAVVRLVVERRLGLGLATNGATLASGRLRAGLRKAGLEAVVLTLPGPTPEVGDRMARREGVTALAFEALGHLAHAGGLCLEVRLVLRAAHRPGELRELVARVADLAGPGADVHAVLPCGPRRGAVGSDTSLDPAAAAELVAAAVEAGLAAGLPIYAEGLPECFAGELATRVLHPARRPFAPGLRGETCLAEADPASTVKPLPCSECLAAGRCPGVPKVVAEDPGFGGVRPIAGVRSNSFDLTEAGEVEAFSPGGEGCPGARIPAARGPEPAVYLVRDGRTAVYRTDTTSFTADEVREITHRRQQLYLDVSDKVALDDFERDVRQLRLQKGCKACPDRPACPSAFEVSDEVPFFREERWLRQEIERMKGRVLDIGCGELRYRDIIGRLVAAGDVEYHGLDPDPEAIARIRESGIPARIHATDVEAFDGPAGYFDYVLMLRSLDHFRDVARTFDLVSRLLRVWGAVIVTECLPFGLLRSREKTTQARASLVPKFEHYRNWSSEQLLELLRSRGSPFRVNVHRPVQPRTANMWLLKLIKVEP